MSWGGKLQGVTSLLKMIEGPVARDKLSEPRPLT